MRDVVSHKVVAEFSVSGNITGHNDLRALNGPEASTGTICPVDEGVNASPP